MDVGARLRQGQAPTVAGWRGQDLASERRGHRTLGRNPNSGAGRHPVFSWTSRDMIKTCLDSSSTAVNYSQLDTGSSTASPGTDQEDGRN